MAATSSRAHLINQLSRRATSSPREEEFATASSFDLARDAIHSTMQLPDHTTQQQLPQQQQLHGWQGYADHISETGSEGSAEMSIELGRGVKRGARGREDDLSSNFVFDMGNDSLYEVTGTPPLRPRDSGRKYENVSRKSSKAAMNQQDSRLAAGPRHRSLSEALNKNNVGDDTSYMVDDAVQHTATFNARNTRFTRSRQTSANEPIHAGRAASGPTQQTPRRAANNNPTAQSNSFMLPDLPDITELVSGVRKDGTPVFNRNTKSRSRFTSGSYKPARMDHLPVQGVPIPDEEKAIYASLQLLKDRVEQLEMEKADAQKRAEEYENELIELRSQLAANQSRPDSGLGSDEETARDKWNAEKTRLHANVKASQDRLDRSERKINVSEIAIKRVTKERDELITQIGVAYYNNEELKAENETFKESFGKLRTEHEDLNEEVNSLRKENQDLRALMAQTQASYDQDTQQRESREAALRTKLQKKAQDVREMKDVSRELREVRDGSQRSKVYSIEKGQEKLNSGRGVQEKRKSTGTINGVPGDDLATRIAEEVRKHRESALAAKSHSTRDHRSTHQNQSTASRARSKSASRPQTAGPDFGSTASKHAVSAPAEADLSDADSTTQLDFTQKSQNAYKRASVAGLVNAGSASRRDEMNITPSGWLNANELEFLRKKLDEQCNVVRSNSFGAVAGGKTGAQQAAHGSVNRRSSLKEHTANVENDTGRFSVQGDNLTDHAKIAKTVRVQSPHTTDEAINSQYQTEEGEISTLSNTSRRRRRAASTDGMTSAFILPDITLNNSHVLDQNSGPILHGAGNCTACPVPKNITIPSPVPVTDREEADMTNATIRPAQSPILALATVIKQLNDEINHLKIQLAAQTRLYNQHDPALGKRRRLLVSAQMDKLKSTIEKRSDQLYALYDVLEGQKALQILSERSGEPVKEMDKQEVEETLSSLGIDPVELSGHVGRKPPPGLDGADDMTEESVELPWEGLSEVGSDEGENAL